MGTFTRANLQTDLQSELGKLATFLGRSDWTVALDKAYARLGYTDDTDTLELDRVHLSAARALASYFGLLLLQKDAGTLVSTSMGAPSSSRADNQIPQNIAILIEEAEQECKREGYPVDANTFTDGYYLLDLREPYDPLWTEANRFAVP